MCVTAETFCLPDDQNVNLIDILKFKTQIILRDKFYGKNVSKWKIAKFLSYAFNILYARMPLGWVVVF